MNLAGSPSHIAVTAVTWVLLPPLHRAELPELCEQLEMLLGFTGATVVVCDVGDFTEPDLVVIDVLARFQLTARRAGARLELARAGPHLRLLLALTGLGVPLGGPLGRQAEEGEQALGVEEVVEPGDPAV